MYELRKINKRLHVVDYAGVSVYCPPSFIAVAYRKRFDALLAQLNTGRDRIHAISSFEAANHPDKAHRLITAFDQDWANLASWAEHGDDGQMVG